MVTRGRTTGSNASALPAASATNSKNAALVFIGVRAEPPLPVHGACQSPSARTESCGRPVRRMDDRERSRGVRDLACRAAPVRFPGVYGRLRRQRTGWVLALSVGWNAHRGESKMSGRKNWNAALHARLKILVPVMVAVAACGGTNDTGSRNTSGAGPAPVDLGAAGDLAGAAGYVILAKTAVTNVPTSAVTGNVGLSPAAASFLSGFSSTLPAGGAASTSAQVVGKMYAPDYAAPTPANLTAA